MKREITEYETNNLHILSFISWCKFFINTYNQRKLMLLPEVAKIIWKMIQEDVFNVNTSEMELNKLIDDVGCVHFYWDMFDMCYIVKQKEEDYIYSINCEDKECISLIGEPIYKFLNKIESRLEKYED